MYTLLGSTFVRNIDQHTHTLYLCNKSMQTALLWLGSLMALRCDKYDGKRQRQITTPTYQRIEKQVHIIKLAFFSAVLFYSYPGTAKCTEEDR